MDHGENADNDIIPEDIELRNYLIKKASKLNWVGWGISGIAIIFVILSWTQFTIAYLPILISILFTGQGIRYYARQIHKRAHNPRSAMTKRELRKYKEEQEDSVRKYFDNNKQIAEKVLLMNNLAQKGNFKDAYNISNSILRKNPPKAVKAFLKDKQKYYRTRFVSDGDLSK